MQALLELLLVVVAALGKAVHHHVLVVPLPHLSRKVLQVLLDLRRIKGALGPKQLQHSHLERPIVLVVFVVVAQRHQVEPLLHAAG